MKPAGNNSSKLLNSDFIAFFSVQFLGAFNDNLFKNALVMLITFRLSQLAEETGLLITLAAGLFILPFFIFSSLAGQIADHYSKTWLVKKIKLAEVMIMGLGALALMSESQLLLFITLFLMGSQSAFFGPIKYALLPELFSRSKLIQANSLFSGSTFIAILIGTIGGGLGVLTDNGLELMGLAIFLVALAGYLFSLKLPQTAAGDTHLKINWNLLSSTWGLVKQSREYPIALFSILTISWFWFIGATLLSQIPALVKYELHADDGVVVLFLTLFSIGIALGAWLVSRLMKNKAHIRWHGLMVVAMSVFLGLTAWFAAIEVNDYVVSRETLLTTWQFVRQWPTNLTLVSMMALAMVGGMYIVPLYTLLQTYTPFSVRARMVAINNVFNAFLMVLSAVLLMLGFAYSLTLLEMLSVLAVANLVVAAVLMKKRMLIKK